jgi:hypothetical protein
MAELLAFVIKNRNVEDLKRTVAVYMYTFFKTVAVLEPFERSFT